MFKVQKNSVIIVIYIIFSIYGFYTLGLPSLLGEITIQTYADSLTYENFAKNLFDELPLVSMASNMLGPVYILKIFDYNYLYIYIFNVIIFIVSIKLIFKYYNIKKTPFFIFFLMTPLVYFSLFNINKEIILILSISLFTVYLVSKKKYYLLFALLIAFLVRWQMVIFLILALISVKLIKRKSFRYLSLLGLAIILSIVYPIMSSGSLADVVAHSEGNVDLSNTGTGLFPLLNNIQKSYGGYVLVCIPKFLQINFGLVARLNMIGIPSDFWNYFVLLLHSVSFLLLFLYMLYKKLFDIKNDLVYVSFLCIVFFSISPIINTRYFLPVYLFWLIVVSLKHSKAKVVKCN